MVLPNDQQLWLHTSIVWWHWPPCFVPLESRRVNPGYKRARIRYCSWALSSPFLFSCQTWLGSAGNYSTKPAARKDSRNWSLTNFLLQLQWYANTKAVSQQSHTVNEARGRSESDRYGVRKKIRRSKAVLLEFEGGDSSITLECGRCHNSRRTQFDFQKCPI